MEVLDYIKENPIADYATLKIRSGVDNKFFDFNIKNMEDQVMLLDLLDKTSKSFFNLEKAFVSFLETGESNFNITKDKVDWVNLDVTNSKIKQIDYTITCKVDFPIERSYLGFSRLSSNEINTINNYIKSAKLYSQGISTKFAQTAITDSNNNLKTVTDEMKKSQLKKADYLDQVYNDFKVQLINVFFEAVSVRSNGLLNADTLRDRINASLTNVTEGEVKDGFYEKLDNARQNFIDMNKEIIDSILLNTDSDSNEDSNVRKTIVNIKEFKEEPKKEETLDPKEFFEGGAEGLHQKLRNTIIVNEKNQSMEEDTKAASHLNHSDTDDGDTD